MIRLWSFFGTTGEDPSNFRGFPEKPVEKPVENVDNFCEKPVRGLWKENLCSANKCVRMKSQCGKNIRSFFPNKISPGGASKAVSESI